MEDCHRRNAGTNLVARSAGGPRADGRPRGGRRRDGHGDVPGWVLVTIMTAGIVAAL
jgi:hypothetical protein